MGAAAEQAEVQSRAADALPPITATTVLTVTVWPSCTRISESTPAEGEGISASTLSVEISKIGSSRATVSPDLLQPLGQCAFGDGFAHLRHQDFSARA